MRFCSYPFCAHLQNACHTWTVERRISTETTVLNIQHVSILFGRNQSQIKQQDGRVLLQVK